VLEERVGRQNGVVGLNDGSRDLRGREDSETQLGLLAVVNGQALQEEGAETRASTTTDSVEDEETLETSAVVSQLADTVEDEIDHLLANGVVTTSVVAGSILLARDELLRVEELTVGTSTDLIDDGGLQVNEDGTGDVFAGASLGEEGVESVITTTDSLVGGHLAIRLNAMLQAEELPAGIADLATSLANVDRNCFSHCNSEIMG
jgi:hypothetical protein